jgi:hypothetical protein
MTSPDFIHWRPAGWLLLACGAPHVPAQTLPLGRPCCRTDPKGVTCPPCRSAALAALTPPFMPPSALGTYPPPVPAGGTGCPAPSGGSESGTTPTAPGTSAAAERGPQGQYRVELAENAAQDWTEEAIQARHVYVEALAAAGLVETASGPMTPVQAAALAFSGELQPGDCEDCQTTGGCRCNEGNR